MTDLRAQAPPCSSGAAAWPDRRAGASEATFAAEAGRETRVRRAGESHGIGDYRLDAAMLVAWRAVAAVAHSETAGTPGAERPWR